MHGVSILWRDPGLIAFTWSTLGSFILLGDLFRQSACSGSSAFCPSFLPIFMLSICKHARLRFLGSEFGQISEAMMNQWLCQYLNSISIKLSKSNSSPIFDYYYNKRSSLRTNPRRRSQPWNMIRRSHLPSPSGQRFKHPKHHPTTQPPITNSPCLALSTA
jgi:hypothetical protein